MRGKKFDREYLVSQIAMMRIEGKSTHFILEFLEKDINMGRTTAYEVLREAQDYIINMTNKDLEKAYSEAIQQLERKMDSISDKRIWIQYRQELNKLQGLYAAQKVEHSGSIGFEGIDIQIVSRTLDESSSTKKDLNDEDNKSDNKD